MNVAAQQHLDEDFRLSCSGSSLHSRSNRQSHILNRFATACTHLLSIDGLVHKVEFLPNLIKNAFHAKPSAYIAQMNTQGHIRVGPDVITDPAFLVTRAMEDFVTWVTGSKIRRTIARYNNQLDDYELMQE